MTFRTLINNKLLLIIYKGHIPFPSERKDKKSKDQAMYEAHLQWLYLNTLKDIAEYIGVHYTTVSRAIKKIEGEDEK